ncbi:MAG: hypothetical protein QOE08_631 [Thermoleophilaceae bacterium]|jgi:hypothetical protein|nr:hypothetical protein [Thermoleophilaceae bacterium]
MDVRIQIVSIVVTAGLLLTILELVRRRRLLERYALLWLFSALALLCLAVWRGLLVDLAHAIGIYSPPNALFVVAFGFILLLLLHFSVAVSKLADQNKVLAQRLAMLEEKQRETAQAVADDREAADPLGRPAGPQLRAHERV